MSDSARLKGLLDRLPDPDQRGTFSRIDKPRTEKAIAEMHKSGREGVLALIDMLVEPGKGNDIKPRYALHCLAIFVSGLQDDSARAEFATALASQIAGRPKAVQEFLIQELQAVGGPEVVGTLGRLLHEEGLCEPAARALVAIRQGAAEPFRAALSSAKGKPRLAIIQSLGLLRDAGAVEALRAALADEDREVRLAAAWGLANIGDAGSAELLLKAAEADGWERIQATKACLLLAERLAAAGKKAEAARIYQHLHRTRTDPAERYIQEAAERGLAAVK